MKAARETGSAFCRIVLWDCFRGLALHYFPMDHNAPCLPPRILHNHCFPSLQGITVFRREIENSGSEKFFRWGGGVNKVHYGLCENGEFSLKIQFCKRPALVTTTFVKPCFNCDFLMKSSRKRPRPFLGLLNWTFLLFFSCRKRPLTVLLI